MWRGRGMRLNESDDDNSSDSGSYCCPPYSRGRCYLDSDSSSDTEYRSHSRRPLSKRLERKKLVAVRSGMKPEPFSVAEFTAHPLTSTERLEEMLKRITLFRKKRRVPRTESSCPDKKPALEELGSSGSQSLDVGIDNRPHDENLSMDINEGACDNHNTSIYSAVVSNVTTDNPYVFSCLTYDKPSTSGYSVPRVNVTESNFGVFDDAESDVEMNN